jgi:hypothetical protein
MEGSKRGGGEDGGDARWITTGVRPRPLIHSVWVNFHEGTSGGGGEGPSSASISPGQRRGVNGAHASSSSFKPGGRGDSMAAALQAEPRPPSSSVSVSVSAREAERRAKVEEEAGLPPGGRSLPTRPARSANSILGGGGWQLLHGQADIWQRFRDVPICLGPGEKKRLENPINP